LRLHEDFDFGLKTFALKWALFNASVNNQRKDCFFRSINSIQKLSHVFLFLFLLLYNKLFTLLCDNEYLATVKKDSLTIQ
jgi:hypothetical protein